MSSNNDQDRGSKNLQHTKQCSESTPENTVFVNRMTTATGNRNAEFEQDGAQDLNSRRELDGKKQELVERALALRQVASAMERRERPRNGNT